MKSPYMFIPTIIATAFIIAVVFTNSRILDYREKKFKAEITQQMVDSLQQKVMRDHDKDLTAIVTYSDNLGWTVFEFIDEGTRNYIEQEEKDLIRVQINGEYKIGTRFYLVPEKE
jgi:hypothetical protein